MPYVERLPSGKYRAIYRIPTGERRSVPGTFSHKKAATNAAALAEAEAASLGWRDPQAATRTWGDWCETWWPTRAVEPGTLYRDRYSRDSTLMTRWGDVPLSSITRHDVKAWAADLARGGMSPATVKRRVYLFSASLAAAIDAEIIAYNPAARIALPGGQKDVRRYLTSWETELLLEQFAPPVDRPINEAFVNTLLGTGMRWGEATGLQINRVDFSRGVIRVAEVWDTQMRRLKPYPKGRKHRDVPIVPWLEPMLRYAITGRRSGFVFLLNDFVFEYANWRKRFWLPAIESSGLVGVRPHDLRHTYASNLLQNGVTLAEVGKLLGHVSPATTQIYAHLAAIPRDAVVAALPDPRHGANVGQRGAVGDFERLQSAGR